MDYMELLDKVRMAGQNMEVAKRELKPVFNARSNSKEVSILKQRYMRAAREYDQMYDQMKNVINSSEDKKVMWALFYRRAKRMPWDQTYLKVYTSRSEMDIRLAVSAYLHKQYKEDWRKYSDCL